MVRHLRPLRVHHMASYMLETGRLKQEPPWYRVVAAVPPTTSLVRQLPVRMSKKRSQKISKRPSVLFKPKEIIYPEDGMRMQFFQDHPWELARPRIVVENDARDYMKYDWSSIKQLGKQLDGER